MYKHTDKLNQGEMQIDLSEAEFLKFLIKTIGATRVLEVGTFRGWSTAVMAEAISEVSVDLEDRSEKSSAQNLSQNPIQNSKQKILTTIELRESEAVDARKYWDEYLPKEVASIIESRIGKASDILKELIATETNMRGQEKTNQYDLIFIDADKGGYSDYFTSTKKLIRKGGLIVLDNMLNAGLVATSARDSTTNHIRNMNTHIFNSGIGEQSREGQGVEEQSNLDLEEFEPYIIPAWDGVVIVRKL